MSLNFLSKSYTKIEYVNEKLKQKCAAEKKSFTPSNYNLRFCKPKEKGKKRYSSITQTPRNFFYEALESLTIHEIPFKNFSATSTSNGSLNITFLS